MFFISLVGVDEKGFVDKYKHIFDIFTKEYDFLGCDVQVISAQDLWKFYKSKHRSADRKKVDIYTLAEYFVKKHQNGHYVFDECPFLSRNANSSKCPKNVSSNEGKEFAFFEQNLRMQIKFRI